MNRKQITERLSTILIGACKKGGSALPKRMADEIAREIVSGKYNRAQLLDMCEATPASNRGTVVDGLLELAEIARSR